MVKAVVYPFKVGVKFKIARHATDPFHNIWALIHKRRSSITQLIESNEGIMMFNKTDAC